MTAEPLPAAFFERAAEGLVATPLTRGPWSADHQHGGPPAALVVRAVEQAMGAAVHDFVMTRVTVDFLRPVPIGPVAPSTPVLARPGRTVQTWTASLWAAGTEVCRASIQLGRREAVAVPERPAPASLKPPSACPAFEFPFFHSAVGYHKGIELRLAAGRFGEGDMALWLRMARPLVVGEEPSPMQRLLVAADAGNGVGVTLPVERYTFVNPDLTVVVEREPEGEWMGLEARTTVTTEGAGTADTALHDARGRMGRALQTLVVRSR